MSLLLGYCSTGIVYVYNDVQYSITTLDRVSPCEVETYVHVENFNGLTAYIKYKDRNNNIIHCCCLYDTEDSVIWYFPSHPITPLEGYDRNSVTFIKLVDVDKLRKEPPISLPSKLFRTFNPMALARLVYDSETMNEHVTFRMLSEVNPKLGNIREPYLQLLNSLYFA